MTVTAEHSRRFAEDGFFVLDEFVLPAQLEMAGTRTPASSRTRVPYLTCWIPLDDVSEASGTVHLLPYARAGTRDVVPHVRDEATNDMIGYTGDDPGDPVVARAGSIVCFSSTVFHRSGPNKTDHMRRVYVAQYSAEPLLNEEGTGPYNLAEPLAQPGPG
jgi:ectoine hydroxylase-related dioxygenase (phytanoyl-CoA dioxygenase family)